MSFALEALQTLFRSREIEERPEAFFVQRKGGLGDVLMALGAVHALRERHPEAKIHFCTESRYLSLAERCPHLDAVHTSESSFQAAIQEHTLMKFRAERIELGAVTFGINRDHEVNAFLLAMNLHAPSAHKTPVVALKPDEQRRAAQRLEGMLKGFPGKRILLHPARGDRNRTWSQASWNELADLILAAGHTPVLVGDDSKVPYKGILKIAPRPGIADLTNRLDLLELVQLCRMGDVFVSPDSGPVQVAALSDIGIVGIYSTVPPRCRLPFRRGILGWRAEGLVSTCPNRGCYHLFLKNDTYFAQLQAAIRQDLLNPGSLATNTFMGDFCAQPGRTYACLTEITPAMAWEACVRLLDGTRHLEQARLLEEAESFLAKREPVAALASAEAAAAVAESPELMQVRALALLALGQNEKAVRTLEALLAAWPGSEPLNLLGMVFQLHGEQEKAGRFFEMATTWNPAHLPTLMNRALHHAAHAQGPSKAAEALLALDLFHRLREDLPPGFEPQVLPAAQADLLQGWLLLNHFGAETAAAVFVRVLEQDPGSLDALLGLAESCFQARDLEEAGRLYRLALEADPGNELAQKRLTDLGAAEPAGGAPCST